MQPKLPPCLTEFGPEFDVPAAIINHPKLIDISWRNDACPSFQVLGLRDVRLWVEHPDPDWREVGPFVGRFFIVDEQTEETALEVENLEEVLEWLGTVEVAPAPTCCYCGGRRWPWTPGLLETCRGQLVPLDEGCCDGNLGDPVAYQCGYYGA